MFLKRDDQCANHLGEFHQFVADVGFLGLVDERLFGGQGAEHHAFADIRLGFLQVLDKLRF